MIASDITYSVSRSRGKVKLKRNCCRIDLNLNTKTIDKKLGVLFYKLYHKNQSIFACTHKHISLFHLSEKTENLQAFFIEVFFKLYKIL